MPCPERLPAFADQIPPHRDGRPRDPKGGLNCTCYSAEMVADFHTCGRVVPSGASIRKLTGDTEGGTNLGQNDYVLRRYFGIDLDTRYRLPWGTFEAEVKGGRAAILQGGYEVIRRSRFRGSETFSGGHAIAVVPAKVSQTPALIGMDPLCDGRRPGLYRFVGEPYPEGLLREFAGELDFGTWKLGEGWVYCSFSRDQRPRAYRVGFRPGPFRVYEIVGGRARAFKKARRFPRNTSAPCTAPRRYRLVKRPDQTRSLVQMTDGSLEGLWVAVPQEHAALRVYP